MKETKLVSLFKGLSIDDLRQIQKMLRSPFYTSNKNLLALFNILRSSYPECNSGKLEKQKVFKKLFPNHTYSDIKLRNLNSDMVRIIENYLIDKRVKSDDFERRKKLLVIYKEYGYLDWFERELKRLTDELDQLPYRDTIYYKHMLDLKLLQLEYLEIKKPNSRFGLLQEWEEMLDQYYLLSKARHKITLKSFKKLIKASGKNTENYKAENNILFNLYEKFDELYNTNDLDLFAEVKKEFEENIHLIRLNFQTEFLSLLTNFAIEQMAIDDIKYNKVALELYKLGLKHEIIFTTNRASDNTYFNIVVCGAKAKEFDWTQDFIERYEKHLSPNSKADIKTISLSTFYLHKKEYSKAIDLIRAHRFQHYQVKSIARTHCIRCYFELYLLDSTYFDLLIYQIESYERFLRRDNKTSEDKLKAGLNFVNFIKKLAILRASGVLKPNQQKEMLNLLNKQKITFSKSWLIGLLKR